MSKVGDAVSVVWVDPRNHEGWREAPLDDDLRCYSVGFLAAKRKDRIVLATNYSPASNDQDEMYGWYEVIPMKQVVSITTLARRKDER